jgi:hypothetical protein
MRVSRSVSRFERLEADEVLETAVRLRTRIEARFPDRNLSQVAAALVNPISGARLAARWSVGRAAVVAVCWAAAAAICVAGVFGFKTAVLDTFFAAGEPGVQVDWVPFVESTINNVVFAGIAVVFLLSIPGRVRRRRSLSALFRLRSVAHVVDMHHLAKDPERVTGTLGPSAESVDAELSAADLAKYLSYCCEMLALLGKAAALHAEETDDAVVLDTVAEVETLTNGIASRIWQKMRQLQSAADPLPTPSADPPVPTASSPAELGTVVFTGLLPADVSV